MPRGPYHDGAAAHCDGLTELVGKPGVGRRQFRLLNPFCAVCSKHVRYSLTSIRADRVLKGSRPRPSCRSPRQNYRIRHTSRHRTQSVPLCGAKFHRSRRIHTPLPQCIRADRVLKGSATTTVPPLTATEEPKRDLPCRRMQSVPPVASASSRFPRTRMLLPAKHSSRPCEPGPPLRLCCRHRDGTAEAVIYRAIGRSQSACCIQPDRSFRVRPEWHIGHRATGSTTRLQIFPHTPAPARIPHRPPAPLPN